MGRLTVHFMGISTHVRFSDAFRAQWLRAELPPHRVVLVVAPGGMLENRFDTAAHHPMLHFHSDGSHVSVQSLRVSVPNASAGEVRYDPQFSHPDHGVPSLDTLTQHRLTDASLSPPVVVGGESAAAHFDIAQGFLTAERAEESQSIYVTAVIETDGPPRLQFDPLVIGRPVDRPVVPDLGDDGEISFGNEDAEKGREEAADFMLHFRIFRSFPAHAAMPPWVLSHAGRHGRHLGFEINGPGCSNSAWP